MNVHGLNADASRSGHASEAHVRAAEKPGAEFLKLHRHGDGRVLIEERARLHHDAFSGLQLALENIAVAVQENQSWTAGGDKTVHEHALAAEQNIGEPFHS